MANLLAHVTPICICTLNLWLMPGLMYVPTMTMKPMTVTGHGNDHISNHCRTKLVRDTTLSGGFFVYASRMYGFFPAYLMVPVPVVPGLRINIPGNTRWVIPVNRISRSSRGHHFNNSRDFSTWLTLHPNGCFSFVCNLRTYNDRTTTT